jgi:S-DNA-T family DNA segregation ATPase FtsK/SpoIIIE
MSALPRIDGRSSADDLSDGVAKLVERISGAWQGPGAPRVRMLPDELPIDTLPAASQTGRRVPFGIDENELAPVMLDFESDPHFVVFGDTECGKSNLLRLVSDGIVARHSPNEARLIFLDFRRSLLDTASTEHRIGYAASSTAANQLLKDIVGALNVRLPPADLTPDQLRSRSWWSGADLYLIVDDYDLVGTAQGNPLLPLVDLLPQARDIGLHVVMSRAMGGAGRSLYDPVVQRLKDMATPALIMSGSRDEGALFGDVRPKPLPVGRGQFVERRRGIRLVQTAFVGGAPAQ